MLRLKRVVIGLAVVATAAVLVARQSGPSLQNLSESSSHTLSEILEGSVIPVTISVKALPATYKSLFLSTDSSTALDFIVASSMGMDEQSRKMLDKLKTYCSGQSLMVDGLKYYITYRPEFPDQSSLRLNLVRCDSVRTIIPFFPEFQKSQASSESNRSIALQRMKQVGLATILYSSDYDDVLPSGQSTPEVVQKLQPYSKSYEIFKSPVSGGAFHYNVHLSAQKLSGVKNPPQTPMWKEDLPSPTDPFAVVFSDGHGKTMNGSDHPIIENAWRNWIH